MNCTAILETTRSIPVMEWYDEELAVADARDQYLKRYGLGDGGYDDDWVFAWVGWLPVVLPNTAGRKREIRAHDLHHVLTGLNARWYEGEIDVSAWEIAAGGCGKFLFGWAILLSMFALGLLIRPRAMFGAFLRGRGARNLFGTTVDGRIYEMKLGDLRRLVGLTKSTLRPTRADRLAFLGWSAVAVGMFAVPLMGLVAALV